MLVYDSYMSVVGQTAMRTVIFDVGANNGDSTFGFTDDPETHVFAFEPTPKLVELLRLKGKGRPNWHVIPCAVSNKPGKAKFNISIEEGGGCSSLSKPTNFALSAMPNHITPAKEIEVDVITLSDFLDTHPEITKIDFLHVDVQGCDAQVLVGLGAHIDKVIAGKVEASLTRETALYESSTTFDVFIRYFMTKHFHVANVVKNENGLECNISFIRQAIWDLLFQK